MKLHKCGWDECLKHRRHQVTRIEFRDLTDECTPVEAQSQVSPPATPFCLPEAGVGLGIGLCSVPYFQCISGIFVHTLSPGSVAHLDGRLRYVLISVLEKTPDLQQREGVPSMSRDRCGDEIFFSCCFLGPHPQHMEVPRLGEIGREGDGVHSC